MRLRPLLLDVCLLALPSPLALTHAIGMPDCPSDAPGRRIRQWKHVRGPAAPWGGRPPHVLPLADPPPRGIRRAVRHSDRVSEGEGRGESEEADIEEQRA